MRHFNAFSETQLIFSRAGPSAAFLWVPFLSPPKEMERILIVMIRQIVDDSKGTIELFHHKNTNHLM
jgi:hypothetical protein